MSANVLVWHRRGGQSAGSAPESKQKESASTPTLKKPASAANKTRKVALKTTSASAAIRKSRFRKKAPPAQGRDDSASETSSPEQEDSEEDSETDGEVERIARPSQQSRKKRKVEKTERQVTEPDCLRQLAAFRAEDKRPPPPISADSFAKKFGLHNDGINLHRMKLGKGITKAEVEEVFGAEKSRNGFLLAEKLSKDLRRAAEKLYCVCYQRSQTPGHVAKEFAIGVVLDKVPPVQPCFSDRCFINSV